MNPKKLLIVDDDPEIRAVLDSLFRSDYALYFAQDGIEALERVHEVQPDLVLLDIIMPRMDGYQTCLRLRKNAETRHIPIVFLTSHNTPQSESFGLELGADDFVIKPFDEEVLKLRVKRRMVSTATYNEGETITLGDCTVYWERQEVRRGEEQILLTGKELSLLRTFVQHAGQVLSREMILERVWSDTFITNRTIDSHVKELRKKIPALVQLLKTVYGAGYRLDL